MMLLSFTVLGAQPSPQTASPSITFRLRVEDLAREPVHAIALRCHVRIDPRGRRYTQEEKSRLYELFGDPSQWDKSLQLVTMAQTAVMVPSFTGTTECDVVLPCTYDLEVASAKYLHAIREGDVPLVFLFSGMAFRTGLVQPVPWDREASYRMPASVWRSTMDRFFPGGGWLRVSSDTIDRLQAFRGRQALVSWDDVIDRLFAQAEPSVEEEIA